MKRHIRNLLAVAAVAILGLSPLGGCFRQSIESTPPPNAAPDSRVGPTPAYRGDHSIAPEESAPATETTPQTATESSDKTLAIEETYVVDAPKTQTAKRPAVEEADLGVEPAAATGAKPKQGGKTEIAAAAPVASQNGAAALAAEMYYVQVGSFDELDNANKVLATLIEQGYDGSKLVMTDDGRFQVRAGAFTDKTAAREALDKLALKYQGAFIRKGAVE